MVFTDDIVEKALAGTIEDLVNVLKSIPAAVVRIRYILTFSMIIKITHQ
jgi:hypothetical protein